jgi:hypothetical protein
MTNLAALTVSRFKHSCDWCGVSLMISLINLGLMVALHWGG